MWVHDILQAREELGEGYRLVQELRLDGARFQRAFRLTVEQFDSLLSKVGPLITMQRTNYRKPIPPDQRMYMCLRYLATGDSYQSIANSYRVGKSTVAMIVNQVNRAIWDALVAEYMPTPTVEDWKNIAEGFRRRWDFPNCVGSIDGKHVVMKAPEKSGSLFFNHKGTYSVVLMAVVDHKYRFRVVDVGSYGRTSDGGVLSNSKFGKKLQKGQLDLPGDAPLPGAAHLGPQPHAFVGDEAFPLRRNLMRPYPGHQTGSRRTFNFRLSHARLVVENTFGILTAQWRVYKHVIELNAENVDALVKATCVLHNYLRRDAPHDPALMTAATDPDGDAPLGLQPISRVGSNNATREAIRVRETFTSYFTNEGAVTWQP